MPEQSIKMEKLWKRALISEFKKDYMSDLRKFLSEEIGSERVIYPRAKNYFQAFDFTPLDKVKVVIVGQDPYHGQGQAHGLCFSVEPGVIPPPSLVNIYKELKSDLGCEIPSHGFLKQWADQGVLLLNSVLSVRANSPGSHRNRGWEKFTDASLAVLNETRENIVFILWGSYAQKKVHFLNSEKHLLLKSPHPSPLSAYRGFFGSRPFSQANDYLKKHNIDSVSWQIDSL